MFNPLSQERWKNTTWERGLNSCLFRVIFVGLWTFAIKYFFPDIFLKGAYLWITWPTTQINLKESQNWKKGKNNYFTSLPFNMKRNCNVKNVQSRLIRTDRVP